MLLRICLYLFLLFLPANYTTTRGSSPLIPADPAAAMSSVCRQLYADMQLDSMVDYTAFEQAITGAQAIERRNKDIITLIDFTKPSTEERLYVLDIRHKRLLFSSLVSHGKNSGGNYATSFSNKVNSYKSSLGFFVTENTYQGKKWLLLSPERLGKRDQRPGKRTGDRSARGELLQPVCCRLDGPLRKKFRLSRPTPVSCQADH